MTKKRLLKFLYFSSFLSLWHSQLLAQGLYINPSSNIVVSGNAYMVLKDCDLHQDGTLTPGTGTVKFSGSTSNATISGSNINFYDLTVDNVSNDVILNNSISVANNVNMVSRHIELNNNNMDLGTTGTIIGEGNSSYITGPAGGWVLRTETLNAPTAANPGNIGIELTTTGNLGSTLIRRGHVQQTGTTSGIGIARYFDFIPGSGNTGLNATLDFHYLDHEINGFTEADLVMSARDVPMGYWNLIGQDGLDLANNVLTKNGIDTLGRFTLTSSQDNPLPIRLISFYGSLLNGQVPLKWEVANDRSVVKYDMEKSLDGVSFSLLGSIEGRNSGVQETYEMTDTQPVRGANYYRLKMHNSSGKVSYSKLIRIDMDGVTTLSVYPNPATEKIVIDFVCTQVKATTFQLLDAQGKVIAVKEIQQQPGTNRVEWNISSLAAATYYLKLQGINDTPIKISKL